MMSVVITCYDRSMLFERAIDSALAQTAHARDAIVVGDASQIAPKIVS
jgi:hypothetical protein